MYPRHKANKNIVNILIKLWKQLNKKKKKKCIGNANIKGTFPFIIIQTLYALY